MATSAITPQYDSSMYDTGTVGYGPTAPGSQTGLGSLTPDMSSGQLGVASSTNVTPGTATLQAANAAPTTLGTVLGSLLASGPALATSIGQQVNAPTPISQNMIILLVVGVIVLVVLTRKKE